MMTAIRLVLAFAMAACALPAAAAESTPPAGTAAAPDSETLAAALALFDGQDLETQLLTSALHMAQASLDTEMEALTARDVDFPPTLAARLQALMFEEIRAMVAEMAPTFRADAAAIYARLFTAAELRELKRLQANPVMKKAEALGPQLLSELARIGMKASAARMPEIQRKGRELVEEWLEDEAMADEGPAT